MLAKGISCLKVSLGLFAEDAEAVWETPVVEGGAVSSQGHRASVPCWRRVLHQHIQKLARVVTVDHRDLRIPRAYHAESPWPSAQAQLGALAAHKSPQDKVACVAACCASLASLLSAAGGAPAAADDLVPVLVFVLVRANPPHLLSTVQFVETFQRAGRCCQGEAAYWWTQFCAAIEFIKTMDY